MDRKTDNQDPAAKLELRRYFLRKYHAEEPIHVLDCCQGGGLLWGRLRKEFEVATYWGVDVKPKKGRLKIDSARILAQPGWPQNIVDVDTYGSPWKHWEALLPNLAQPATVFLTIGLAASGYFGPAGCGAKALGKEALRAMGLHFAHLHPPPGLLTKILGLAVTYCLTRTCVYGIIIVEAVEAVSTGNARYIGVRLQPGTGGLKPPSTVSFDKGEAKCL